MIWCFLKVNKVMIDIKREFKISIHQIMRASLVLFLLIHFNPLIIKGQAAIAIYDDQGVWEEGVMAFEQFLNWKGITHQRITAYEINTDTLTQRFKAIYFPGGNAADYQASIDSAGIEHMQQMVTNGGAYIGICAGAYFACDTVKWQGDSFDYPLNLFHGNGIGPIDRLATWPDYDMTMLSMNLNNSINRFEPTKEAMLYWGGAVFEPAPETKMDTLATYDDFNERPAMVNFDYGKGRVLLIGPHPEIEEDSDRDSTNTAKELNDLGSDWNFLWTATDWLLGNPLTHTDLSSVSNQIQNSQLILYPNPTKGILRIKLSRGYQTKRIIIFDQNGKIFRNQQLTNPIINLSSFHNGIYFIKIETTQNKTLTRILIKE